MKLILQIFSGILLCSNITYGMELNLSAEETTEYNKLYQIISNPSALEKANDKSLIDDVCRAEYAGERNQELKTLGKTIASLLIFKSYKAENYAQKLTRTSLFSKKAAPFFRLLEIIISNQNQEHTKCSKALDAFKQIASAALDHLNGIILNYRVILNKQESDKSPETPAELLYIESLKKILEAEKKLYAQIMGFKLPVDPTLFNESEMTLILEYFDKSKDSNCAQEFADCLQMHPQGTPIELQILNLKISKLMIQCSKPNPKDFGEEGKQVAIQFLMSLYSAPLARRFYDNYLSSFNANLAVLGTICAQTKDKNDVIHTKTLEGFRIFFKAIAEKLASCKDMDFSKGVNQDLPHNEDSYTAAVSIFKNMQNLATKVSEAHSHEEIIEFVQQWEMEDIAIRTVYQKKLEALLNV